MRVFAYTRISTDGQDLRQQEYLLLRYASKHQLGPVHEFIGVTSSGVSSQKVRKIEELRAKMQSGDVLLVSELSRLGRNMLETLGIIEGLTQAGIQIIFVKQPELSTDAAHSKLLLAVYSYFAEAERAYIAMRTKAGLEAAKAKGVKLGRPKGSKNKKGRTLDKHRSAIKKYLELGVPLASIVKIINEQLDKPITYGSFQYFVNHDEELAALKT